MRTVLESKPEYLKAIGLVVVEFANLEAALSTLLGATLGVPPNYAQVLYFTSKSTVPRIDILANVAEISLGDVSKLRAEVEGLVRRAKAVAGRRHELIHSGFGLTEDESSVVQMQMPMRKKPGSSPLPLKKIEDLVADIRRLTDDVMAQVMKAPPRSQTARVPYIHVGPTPPGS